jgi:hypothetical protein
MKNEIYEISSAYMSDLKKLLKEKKVSKYDIAHASFRKNNSAWIIQNVNKAKLTITYLCGDTKQFPTYNSLMKEIKIVNQEYKPLRRKFIKRYYKVVNALTKHRATKDKSISNTLTPEQVKLLAQLT